MTWSSRVLRLLPALALVAAGLGLPAGAPPAPPVPTPVPVADAQPSFPITAAFYYGWGQTNTRFTPLHGTDDTLHPSVARRHVETMRFMGMEAGISSWWGAGSPSDRRIPNQLRAADGTPFRWSLYYELEGPQYPDPSVAKIRADLAYLQSRYAGDRSYLRIGGKPVLFVWAGPEDGCAMASRWKAADTLGFYVVLKRFYRSSSCAAQPVSWHDYGPASRVLDNRPWSYSISPGFSSAGEARPRLARSLAAWRTALAQMKASGARWQLITTFNEWGEGTAVEAAAQWRSRSGHGRYADLAHDTYVAPRVPLAAGPRPRRALTLR
jgi:hypothetical protein